MDNELYSRQRTLDLHIPTSLTVAGVGGIGANAAIQASMTGVPTIYLFDPDVMEESNRNRIPVCQGSINRPKVEVVAEYIRAIRPDCNVIAIQEKLEGILLSVQLAISEVIMDCTDSPKAQFAIYNACKKARVTYIRAGYNGTHITGTSAVSGWIKTDEEEATYTINPSWSIPAVIIAALAVGKMEKFPNQEISLDISEIGIPVLQKKSRLTARCRQASEIRVR